MKTYILLTSLLTFVLSPAQADLTIISEIQNPDVNPAGAANMTMKLSGNKVRVDTGPAHIIILPTEQKMLVLVPDQQMCMVKSLKDPAPATDKQGTAPTIERTGKKETINGFDCEQVLIKYQKGDVTEIWTSPQAPDMAAFASTFQAVAAQNPKKSKYDWTGVLSEKDLNTYPIRAISRNAEGKEESRMTVLSISKDTIPASEFVKPDGYQEIVMPDFGGVGGTDIGGGSGAPSGAPANPMQAVQEMQKKIQNGVQPSAEDLKKMEDMAKQMQQQMQSK